jgi:sugar/nucleoside kinase (ribokinase family)
VRLCTLGDLLLDVIVRLAQPLAEGTDATAETRAGAGGQAANVAAWAAELGAEARFVGKRGDDQAGRLVTAELTARGVEVVGPVATGRNGVVVAVVTPDGERAMATDRGVAPALTADELDPRWFDGCDRLHVSGYALMGTPIGAAALAAAKLIARVSVDLSSTRTIRDFGAARLLERLDELAPEVVFANERELEELGRRPPAQTVVVKRGAHGFSVHGADYPAAAADVVDTTGAGDALAAGFLVGGPGLAAQAAARCVAKLGAMP